MAFRTRKIYQESFQCWFIELLFTLLFRIEPTEARELRSKWNFILEAIFPLAKKVCRLTMLWSEEKSSGKPEDKDVSELSKKEKLQIELLRNIRRDIKWKILALSPAQEREMRSSSSMAFVLLSCRNQLFRQFRGSYWFHVLIYVYIKLGWKTVSMIFVRTRSQFAILLSITSIVDKKKLRKNATQGDAGARMRRCTGIQNDGTRDVQDREDTVHFTGNIPDEMKSLAPATCHFSLHFPNQLTSNNSTRDRLRTKEQWVESKNRNCCVSLPLHFLGLCAEF